MKKLTAILLSLTLLLCGCDSSAAGATNLMEDVPVRIVCLAKHPDRSTEVTDFAVRLFQTCLIDEKNTLISPLSVLSALGMTANGADGETLSQMETVLGSDREKLNYYLYSLMDGQSEQLKLANSIWFRDHDLNVKDVFLETNANYYQADMFQAPMDTATLDAINSWVEEHTDGMIPKILENLDPDTVMCLINALTFDAKWEDVYESHQVGESTFTLENGIPLTVEYMKSTEHAYLEAENATGFIKYYEGRNYAFVALLPKEGMTVAEYAETLTGEGVQALLSSPQDIVTYVTMPKFETEYDVNMAYFLQDMGMMDAFNEDTADFSQLGTSENGNIYISKVIHKTRISVAEEGTKAAAVTAVIAAEGAAAPIEDYRRVTLDRPFVYMLIDCRENVPIFIGTLMDP